MVQLFEPAKSQPLRDLGGIMLRKIVARFGQEFVELSCEGDGRGTAAEETQAIFRRMSAELGAFGLTLDHVLRTRLWGRDRASRDAGSVVRVDILSGGARSASSSYIAPDRFERPDSRVIVDLLALKSASAVKQVHENDPPRTPIRYLTVGPLVVLSGMTCQLANLDEQLADIMPRVGAALNEAGCDWSKIVHMSGYLHRSQTPEALKAGIARFANPMPRELEIAFVDGYSQERKLIEIETTALR